jgi:hypothetical protein
MRAALLAILLLLVLAATVSADPYRFEPPIPTDETFVALIVDTTWRDSCPPRDPQITRVEQVIDVLWTVPRDIGCLPAVLPWKARVPIGVLEPGSYEVRLRANDFNGIHLLGIRTLVVGDASPAFEAVPEFVNISGGMVDLRSPLLCVTSPREIEQVLVDGVSVQYNVDPCSVIVFMPAHAAGPVDIAVQVRQKLHTVRAAVRYIDADATPDDAVFERILLPVLGDGPGAFGSIWRTDHQLRNLSNQTLHFVPFAMRRFICDGDCFRVPPGGTTGLHPYSSPTGAVLFIPRDIADDIRFGLVVRDVSRDHTAWGTEIPVVRERDAERGVMMLANVPFDPRYRLNLRLYAIDGGPASFQISVIDEPELTRSVTLQAACDAPPCNSMQPGFRSIDLNALFPAMPNRPRTLLVQPVRPEGRLFWSMVSVTNNDTQHVTTITPQ